MTRIERKKKRARNVRKYTANILTRWQTVTPAELTDGRAWYVKARNLAREISPGDLKRGAGIIAALSPRVHWSRNMVAARAVAEAFDTGLPFPEVRGILGRNVDKAWRIAQGEAPESVLGGPKVNAFYRNICGDLDAVTVDTWASKVAHPDAPEAIRELMYQDITQAYQIAAITAGIAPAELQAALWINIRGRAN
jgi:hypothetical protein